MKPKMRSAFCLACLLSGITMHALALEGQILDANTKGPVPGVFVVAGWDGQLSGIAVQPHSKCFKSEVAITDALGRFSLSEFAAKMNPFIVNQHRTIGIYKPGFQEVSRSEDSRRFEVIRRMDSNPKEFDDVRGSYLPLGCGVDDRKLVPVMKALAAELAQLARTTKQKEQVGDMLFNIDFIEGGQEEAFRKAQQRRAAAKREGAGK